MSELTIAKALKLGVKAHSEGRLHEADKYYTSILTTKPNHGSANFNMGLLAVELHQLEQAVHYFEKAVEAKPFLK